MDTALDKVDISAPAYRPNTETGVEISYAAGAYQSCAYDGGGSVGASFLNDIGKWKIINHISEV